MRGEMRGVLERVSIIISKTNVTKGSDLKLAHAERLMA